jgi:hypothetical protein
MEKMTDEQKKELERFHANLSDKGERLNKGTIPWLIEEALDNIYRLTDQIDAQERPSKKIMRAVLKDLRDQLRELKRRFE